MEERESTILEYIIRDYIRTVDPVSSERVSRRGHLDLSPATIRNAMAELDEEGYLEQPHTSGGRIPTDKAYRYFVDNLFSIHTPGVRMTVEIDQQTVRKMAKRLKMFVAVFDDDEEVISAGIDEVFDEPEFKEYAIARAFAEILENIDDLAGIYAEKARMRPRVYIGSEHPFKSGAYFGSIFFKDENSDSVIVSLGPKRMNYERALTIMRQIYE